MAETDIEHAMDNLRAAYAQCDFDRLSDLLDEGIEWMIYAPVTIFPFAGPRRGREAAVQALREIIESYVLEAFQHELVVTQGDRVAVMADVRLRQRATQRALRYRCAEFMRFKDGRLVDFRQFINSFDVAEQALGRELAV